MDPASIVLGFVACAVVAAVGVWGYRLGHAAGFVRGYGARRTRELQRGQFAATATAAAPVKAG